MDSLGIIALRRARAGAGADAAALDVDNFDRCMAVRGASTTRRTAMSVNISVPTSSAGKTAPLLKVTSILLGIAISNVVVTMCPVVSITIPEPISWRVNTGFSAFGGIICVATTFTTAGRVSVTTFWNSFSSSCKTFSFATLGVTA